VDSGRLGSAIDSLLSSTSSTRRRTFLFDLAIAVALAGLMVVVTFSVSDEFSAVNVSYPTGLEWLLAIGPAWAVPFRRLVPVPALLLGVVMQMVIWASGYPDSFLATAVLIYSAAAAGTVLGRRAAVVAAVGLTLWTVAGVLTGPAPLYAIPIVALLGATATALGWSTANRQAYTTATVARAEALERSRTYDRERALEAERARIARELHDVVAHGLSVMVVQASAARRILDRDPAGAASALEQIEDTGRNALGEMRHVLAAIRTDPGESWQPAPGLGALDELVDEMAATGVTVDVQLPSTDGRIDTDPVGPLPATVDLTAYRIVQEALTNVLKHVGSGAKATVEVVRRSGALDLRIVDDGRAPTTMARLRRPVGLRAGGDSNGETGDPGHGLRGIRERVEVFGGDFAAGPRPNGGFAVSVSLPLDNRSADGNR
jgi:signal transduction histidine kinase